MATLQCPAVGYGHAESAHKVTPQLLAKQITTLAPTSAPFVKASTVPGIEPAPCEEPRLKGQRLPTQPGPCSLRPQATPPPQPQRLPPCFHFSPLLLHSPPTRANSYLNNKQYAKGHGRQWSQGLGKEQIMALLLPQNRFV